MPRKGIRYLALLTAGSPARNLILFTILIDASLDPSHWYHSRPSILWNIFYHFIIDDADRKIIQQQCQKLVELANSATGWEASAYSAILRFVSHDTRTQVMSRLECVAKTSLLSKTETESSDARYRKQMTTMRENRLGGTVILQTRGQLGPFSLGYLLAWIDLTRSFWKMGKLGSAAITKIRPNSKTFVNPLFAEISGPEGEWIVHYTTNPLEGFYLAPVVDSFNAGVATSPQKATEEKLSTELIDALVISARSQFSAWCSAFIGKVKQGRCTIRLLCNDVLSTGFLFRQYIDDKPIPCLPYARHWSFSPLVVEDQSMSREGFDVIDSSNVADHLGLVNILIALSPLLSTKSTATLYTENLQKDSADDATLLERALMTDPVTFGCLLDIVPVAKLVGISLSSAVTPIEHGCMGGDELGHQADRIRLTFKKPDAGDMVAQSLKSPTFSMTAEHLADILVDILFKMIWYEDIGHTMRLTSQKQMGQIFRQDYYSRASWVALVDVCTERFPIDVEELVARLLHTVENDTRSLLVSNFAQELYLLLGQHGIQTMEVMQYGPRDLPRSFGVPPMRPIGMDPDILGDTNCPTSVYISLQVPILQLRRVMNIKESERGTPPIHISIRQAAGAYQFDNSFASIHCSFGEVVAPRGSPPSEACIIREENKGWRKSSNLIVTCRVPAWGMLVGPRNGISVSLCVSTRLTTVNWSRKLGITNSLYSAQLNDESAVFINAKPPRLLGLKPDLYAHNDLHAVARFLPAPDASLDSVTVHSIGIHRARELCYRIDLSDDREVCSVLQTMAIVTVIDPTPCSVLVKMGTWQKRIRFPMPVDIATHRLRVARKSKYIEVIISMVTDPKSGGYASAPFPIVTAGGLSALRSPWDAPKVNCNQLSTLKIGTKAEMGWVARLLGSCLTAAEGLIARTPEFTAGQARTTPLHDVKQTIQIMTLARVGLHHQTSRRAQFFDFHSSGAPLWRLFVHDIYHDSNTHSIVLDAFLSSQYNRVARCPEVIIVKISAEEQKLWMSLLPLLAERCRDYPHSGSCEYAEQNRDAAPSAKIVLCSCGEGKSPPPNETGPRAPEREWFFKHGTRLAISPLFPLSYIDPLPRHNIKEMKKQLEKMKLDEQKERNRPKARRRALEGKENRPVQGTPSCDACGAAGSPEAKLMKCGQCHLASYCSRDCQKKDWKSHKLVCGE